MSHTSPLPSQWRPREKLLRYGPAGLSAPELWGCILGVGRPGKPVHKLARWVADRVCSPRDLSLEVLQKELGNAQAARVTAICELMRRKLEQPAFLIQSVQDVLLVVKDLATARQEQVQCLYLSATNQLLHTEQVALGTLNAALLHPRDLFFPIRLQPVAHIIICHNHPSNNTKPSDQDTIFTKRVEAACDLLGITLYDHVIVGKTQHFSFREAGLLHAAK